MTHRLHWTAPLLAIIALAVFALVMHHGDEPAAVHSMSIGMEATPVNSLIYIAEEQGFFKANGLDLTIRDDYTSGSAAAEGMLRGEVDIATAAELALVRHAFKQQDVCTFATIDRFMHQQLIARRDRGISSQRDLEGKRIGVPLKTAAEFNLGRFFELHHIDPAKVSLVDVQAPQAASAIAGGLLDAVVVWQPNVVRIAEDLGDGAISWSIQNGQPTYCAVMTTRLFSDTHPETIARFLDALFAAETYLAAHPAEGRALIQRRLAYDDTHMAAIWPGHNLSLALEQSLIVAMEDEARWMMKNGDGHTMPDFLDYIVESRLQAISPRAVNIIR